MNMNVLNDKIILEDDIVLVYMKKDALTNGELLLTTKKHFDNFDELDANTILHISNVLRIIKNLIVDKLNPSGIQVFSYYGINNPYNAFYIDIKPIYSPQQPLVDIDIIYDKLK